MKLEKIWHKVDKLNAGPLMPIYGGGKTYRPRVMFVFINPTSRNVSSDPGWTGPRYPFVGTKQIWRIFSRAGLFDDSLLKRIEEGNWDNKLAEDVLGFLKRKDFYFTNIVKATGKDAALPDSKAIANFLPLLKEEIDAVKPDFIVTFGLIPFEAITERKIKLNDYFSDTMRKKRLKYFEKDGQKIVPCYFPIGRGNPKRAVEMLRLVSRM